MFDLGFAELLVIGIVALIVVGPKDLPVMFRKAGQFMGRIKGMAREFSRAMNDAADDAGVKDVANTIKTATNPVGAAMDGVKDAAKAATAFDPSSETGKLSAERDAMRQKIEATTARKNAERLQKEAEAALQKANELEASVEPPKAASKPAAKKPATKKTAAKKPPAKKPAAKKPAAKKPPKGDA